MYLHIIGAQQISLSFQKILCHKLQSNLVFEEIFLNNTYGHSNNGLCDDSHIEENEILRIFVFCTTQSMLQCRCIV